jgi:hypothetical protein
MNISNKYIRPFIYVGFLLIGIITYTWNPIQAISTQDVLPPDLQINSEPFSHSEIAVDKSLPVDEDPNTQNNDYEVSVKETESKKESHTEKGSLAVLKQTVSHTISHVEIPAIDGFTLFRHLKISPNKSTRLLDLGVLFIHSFNISPPTSSIVINAP